MTKIQRGQSISIWIDRKQLENLQRLSREKSIEQDRAVSASELIRDAVSKQYPSTVNYPTDKSDGTLPVKIVEG